MRNGVTIRHADGEHDIQAVRTMFSEYQQWLDVDLCFQGFAEELQGLPGKYQAPGGCLLLACENDSYAGVVGIRPLDGLADQKVCEMKRLYVRPPWRGAGIGRSLSAVALGWAREAGYERICLDTLENLKEARSLYESQGFQEIEAYYDNPLDSPIYMEKNL